MVDFFLINISLSYVVMVTASMALFVDVLWGIRKARRSTNTFRKSYTLSFILRVLGYSLAVIYYSVISFQSSGSPRNELVYLSRVADIFVFIGVSIYVVREKRK